MDLPCFIKQISVGPEFEWLCPYCPKRYTDGIPVVVDNLMLGILRSHGPNSKKQKFQITSDGQICDDSESESESESEIVNETENENESERERERESEDEENFEDESP